VDVTCDVHAMLAACCRGLLPRPAAAAYAMLAAYAVEVPESVAADMARGHGH